MNLNVINKRNKRMIFAQMKYIMVSFIRQARIVQNVDRHTFLEFPVVAALLLFLLHGRKSYGNLGSDAFLAVELQLALHYFDDAEGHHQP